MSVTYVAPPAVEMRAVGLLFTEQTPFKTHNEIKRPHRIKLLCERTEGKGGQWLPTQPKFPILRPSFQSHG